MKNPTLVAFGQHIRALRKQRGISQEDLAALAGLDRSYLGHVERGEKNVTILKVYQLSIALSLEPHELIPSSAITQPKTEN